MKIKCLSHLFLIGILLSLTAAAQEKTREQKQLKYWGARFENAIAGSDHYERAITAGRLGKLGRLASGYLPQLVKQALNYTRSSWTREMTAKAIGKIYDASEDSWILEDTMNALREMNLETRDDPEIEKIKRYLFLLGYLEGTEDYLFEVFSSDIQFDENGKGTYVPDKIVWQISFYAGLGLRQKPEFVRAHLGKLFEISKYENHSALRERALYLIKNSEGNFKPFEEEILYVMTHDIWDNCRSIAAIITKKDDELKEKIGSRLMEIALGAKEYFISRYARETLEELGGLSVEANKALIDALKTAQDEKEFDSAFHTVISAGAIEAALPILGEFQSDKQKQYWVSARLADIIKATPKAVDLVVTALLGSKLSINEEEQVLRSVQAARAHSPQLYYILSRMRDLARSAFHRANDDLARRVAGEIQTNWKNEKGEVFAAIDLAGLWPVNVSERTVSWPLTEKSPQFGIYIHPNGHVFWIDLFRAEAEIEALDLENYIGTIRKDPEGNYVWQLPQIPNIELQGFPTIEVSKNEYGNLKIHYTTNGGGALAGLWSSTFGPDMYIVSNDVIFFEQENPLSLLEGFWKRSKERDFVKVNGTTIEICNDGRTTLGERYTMGRYGLVSSRTSCDEPFARGYRRQTSVELASISPEQFKREQTNLRTRLKGNWKFDKFIVHYQYVDVDNEPYRVRESQREEKRDLNFVENIFVGKYEAKVPQRITFSTNGHDIITLDGVSVPVHLNGAFQTIFLDSETDDPRFKAPVAAMNKKYTELLKRKKPLKLKFLGPNRIQISLGDIQVVDGTIDEYRIEIVKTR